MAGAAASALFCQVLAERAVWVCAAALLSAILFIRYHQMCIRDSMGSTDVGDVSWLVPTAQINTATSVSYTHLIEEVRKLYESSVPIFAICLGHQLMALATGAKTYKLKYGHRGGNHPVKDLETGRVYITSQNHGYAVDEESLDPSVAVPAFVNVNDKTNEGLKYVGKNIFTVQYHPEACPGPLDSGYLFDRFMRMMEERR